MTEANKQKMIKHNNSKYSLVIRAISITWYQFAQISSFHGIKYTIDRNGNSFTRVFWFIISMSAFITANVLVNRFWLRYISNPTRMNVESNHIPLSKLEFPVLTLCQVNRLNYDRAQQLINTLTLPPNITNEKMMELLQQTNGFIESIPYKFDDLELLQEILTTNRYTIEFTMNAIIQPCNELLVRCRWKNVIRPCMTVFEKSLSYDGYCCSFNLKRQFRTTNHNGITNGLSVVLDPHGAEGLAYSSAYNTEGVRLLIHETSIFPGDLSLKRMLSRKYENAVRLTVTATSCSNEVLSLPYEDRGCLLQTEKKLRFFKEYREYNCEVECRMLEIYETCHCLPYQFPNVEGIPMCNFTQIACLVDNFAKLYDGIIDSNSTSVCSCPSDCYAFLFDAEINKIPFLNGNFTIDPFYLNLTSDNMIAHIFFGRQVYKRIRRDLLTSIISLVANLGGVYSFFVGISVITFFEIIYFSTVRLYENYGKLIKQIQIQNGLYENRFDKSNIIKVNDNYSRSVDDNMIKVVRKLRKIQNRGTINNKE